MKYFSEIIFWICVVYWCYFRQTVQTELPYQTITDLFLLLAGILALMRYWSWWKNAQKKTNTPNKKNH